MVKKCIFALAVVALLVTIAPAQTPNPNEQPSATVKRDGDWPWTYKAIDLCVMPIYMDVGHFVQLEKCGDREVILKQVVCSTIGKGSDDFPCYEGCEEIKVRANFPAILGANISKVGPILDGVDKYWVGDNFQLTGSGAWEPRTICVKAWKAKLWEAGSPNNKTHVGNLTITVKPPDGGG